MSNPTALSTSQPRGLESLAIFLMRHFVAVAGTRYDLDDHGNRIGEPSFFACSGFVMSFGDEWFLVTAGHVLNLLDQWAESRSVDSWSLLDFFGPEARIVLPTPFDYEGARRFCIDDGRGLDFGLIHLRPFYRDGLQANGVLPIGEENWIRQREVNFDSYVLVGLPTQLNTSQIVDCGNLQQVIGIVRPVMMTVRRLDLEADEPDSHAVEWFVGQLPRELEIPNIDGMSGAPIIGFRTNEDGQSAYWVVALQSRWLCDSRIIFGSSVPEFARRAKATIAQQTNNNDDSLAKNSEAM